MRAFLTGGTGFIGLALIERMLADGIEVMSVAEAPPPDWAAKALGDGVRFGTLDIADRGALTQALRDWGPDFLVHGAAMTPDVTRERAGDAAAIFNVNVAGTANALEAAAAAGVGRVMAFSSAAAYGPTPDEAILDEVETICEPVSLYSISKFAAEKVALRLGDLLDVSVATPRLSAAWGPWEYVTPHRQTPSPACQIVRAVLDGARPTVPEGAVLPLIFSGDAADMLIRLARSEAGGIFNVGGTEMIDLAAFAGAVADASGVAAGAEERVINLFTPDRPISRMDRLAAAIGSLPVTDVQTAIGKTLDWHARVGLA